MGLEIYYDLHAATAWEASRVKTVVARLHGVAMEQGFAEVDAMLEHGARNPRRLIVKDPPASAPGLQVASEFGWSFRTWPGGGCESAFFGLCHYPAALIDAEGAAVPTGWGEGWHFHAGCKTQYADRVSREHFLRCHGGLVAVLDACREAGLETNVRDGGGYWENRDLVRLGAVLDSWNGLIAAIAGSLKDSLEDSGGQVESPIFANPDFERLELEGREGRAGER